MAGHKVWEMGGDVTLNRIPRIHDMAGSYKRWKIIVSMLKLSYK